MQIGFLDGLNAAQGRNQAQSETLRLESSTNTPAHIGLRGDVMSLLDLFTQKGLSLVQPLHELEGP